MGRPSKPIISKELAVRAALEVVDDEGIEGLTVQLVARKLGVKAPSLYYHFKGKSEMLEEIARMIQIEAIIPHMRDKGDWREQLIELAVAVRASILRHPKAAPLLLQFFPRHLMLKYYDFWVNRYDIPAERRMVVIEGVEKLTYGSALIGAMSRANGASPMPEFDEQEFPHLAEAVKANPMTDEQAFIETLKVFLYAF
ncbi:TetR/AcrR family transcriptional regulator [Metapseudomonas boanensis]|uniref:TetR/AcrR family transcriptional regulator n=1 Tax=Metapseudomonas boanensis TaxID=2822138 RepID=A0ABS5XG99_9GAMM|nr:TetR/AcrR family transcriptional regulator [Pseudomonas boanensis]MBT8766720.1 TetR/AcrR family transcriptional regulator [Pseudomonas boanensis]